MPLASPARAQTRVFGWGENYVGQVGDGTQVERRSPVETRMDSGGAIRGAARLAIGNDHSLALMANGTVKAWGYNNFGQLGDGTTITRLTAVTVTGLSGVVAVA